MKKRMHSILAAVLALVLLGACVIPALAATAETVTQYGEAGGYLAIGDSISRGCGAEGFYIDQDKAEGGQYDELFLRNVQGAFPTQLAAAFGCKMPDDITDQDANFWPLCYPGMTTGMVMDLLGIDDGFKDEALNYPYYGDMLQYFGWEGSFDGVREGESYRDDGSCGQCGNIMELIPKADVITVQLGMCDVYYRAYRIATSGGSLAGGADVDLSSPEAIANLVASALRELKFGFEYWKQWYPVLIETLQKMNPDADIVMVGAFNLINELTLLDDTMLPIGDLITAISSSMNACYRQWEKQFGVKFADITNAETLSTESGWSLLGEFKDNAFPGTHPSQKGYDYITRQILAELPPETTSHEISVDLGRFNAVDYVLVNGIPVKNYTLDHFRLTVHYAGPGATSLTIGVKNADGTLSVQTYQLVYHAGAGYTAYRVAGSNDFFGTLTKPLRTIVKLFRALFEKLAELVKNLSQKG